MEIVCTICRSNKSVVLKDSFLNRYKCSNCDHSFTVIDEKRRTHYVEDYYALKHANWFNNPNYWLFRFIYTNMIALAGKKNIKLLDVGCGNGDFLKYIKGMNSDIQLYGIDLRENYYPGINFMKGDFLTEGYNMKFDIICSLATIEHIDDVVLFVKKINELLLPGGLVIIMTDNTGGIFYGLGRILKRIGISTPYYSLYELAHLQHFTNRSLRTLLRRYGFEVILQRNHNYPVRAVDLPTDNLIMRKIYLLGVWAIFSLSSRSGILQTAFCRKKAV